MSRWRRLLAGSFIFVEASAFRKISGFDNAFFAGEELDLAKRLHLIAKQTEREIIILHRHPILTSDRKAHLYTGREHLRFLLAVILSGFRPSRVMKNKAACFAWYDGRR